MARKLFLVVFMCSAFILVTCQSTNIFAQEENYYVSSVGNDNNPGTLKKPFKSIKKACNMVSPGGTIFVRGGVYHERITISSSGSEDEGYITITNYPGENPILDGSKMTVPNEHTGMVLIDNKSYIRISGFEIRNYKTNYTSPVPMGVHIRGSASNIEIINNNIHNIETGSREYSVGNAHGIAVYGTSSISAKKIIIEGNEIYDCKLGSSEALTINGNVEDFRVSKNYVHNNDNIGIAVIGWEDTSNTNDQARKGVVDGNTVSFISCYGNPAYGNEYCAGGIYSDGARDIKMEKNRVFNCDIGIEVASEHKGKSTSNIEVLNNIIYNNNLTGIAFGGYDRNRGSTLDCKFLNNTLYNNDTKATGCGEVFMQFSTSGNIFCSNILYANRQNIFVSNEYKENSNNVFDYNIYYSTGGESKSEWLWKNKFIEGFDKYRSATGNDKNSKYADPMFVTIKSGYFDFQINEGSAAIESGDVDNCAEYDFNGNSRNIDQLIDCGAYEFGVSLSESKTYSLSGYVGCDVKTQYQQINRGIKVEIVQTGAFTYTDSEGYFQLTNVPYSYNGYTLRISKSMFLTREIRDVNLERDVLIGSVTTPITMWAGDLNMDGALTVQDIMLISKSINFASKDLGYNSLMDLNFDSAINLEDVMIVAKNFGKTVSDYPVFNN